mmetsp:Transcript_9260/g.21735  ORF Transcript_9260/g.21735 Transcript_9260/m.21735 type:complete len:252 (-) Transcript_9260:733-1488(-)
MTCALGARNSAPFCRFILCAKRSPSKLSGDMRNPQSPFHDRTEPLTCCPMTWSNLELLCRGAFSASTPMSNSDLRFASGCHRCCISFGTSRRPCGCAGAMTGIWGVGAGPNNWTCAACGRPRLSNARRNCTLRPALPAVGSSPRKASLCTKRSPSNFCGQTMNPHGSLQERSTPVSTSPLSTGIETPAPSGFGRAVTGGSVPIMESSRVTLVACALPLASLITSKPTARFTTTCANSAGLDGGVSSSRCSW